MHRIFSLDSNLQIYTRSSRHRKGEAIANCIEHQWMCNPQAHGYDYCPRITDMNGGLITAGSTHHSLRMTRSHRQTEWDFLQFVQAKKNCRCR